MNCMPFIICPLLPNELQRKREGLASSNYLDIIAMFHVWLKMNIQNKNSCSFYVYAIILSFIFLTAGNGHNPKQLVLAPKYFRSVN